MKNSIPKIGLILIAIITFPTLFFSIYEVNNLSKNEQLIDSIYSSQLSSIVFSLNQYSDDVINSWASNIENIKDNSPTELYSDLDVFLKQNISIDLLFFANDSNIYEIHSKETNKDSLDSFRDSIMFSLKKESAKISKLHEYFKGGYRKIQDIETSNKDKSLMVFALNKEGYPDEICGLLLNSNIFIRENLGPKIQNMSQDKFFISVFDKENNEEVYTNELFIKKEHKIRIREELWLFSGLEIGVQLNGDPIEKMVNQRARNNIILLIIMDAVLLFGAWLVYKNVRREIQLSQIKSDFVSNVSHEIKTPLALINMYSETLEMGRINSEEKKNEYIKVIHKEANRLSRMVNKILNFSKIESGKRKYNFVETELNEVVNQIVSTYQHHFENSDFQYQLNLADNLPLIYGDQEAITDAINNLIDNAIKYSNDIKLIKINTGVSSNQVYVEIIDSGIGIPEKEQHLIFDKFYRVTKGDIANKVKGSGIGLSIVKHIIDSHNGTISLKSKFNEGSNFTLYFPTLQK